MAQVRLQNGRGLLLQDLAESPLGEYAFARGDRQVGAPGDLGEHVDVLALDGLFHEEGLVGFEFLDEQLGRLGTDRPVEVDGQVDFRSGDFPQPGEVIRGRVDEGLVLDDPRRTFGVGPGLEAGETLRDPVLDRCRVAAALVQPDPVPRRTAQQLVHRHAQGLARQVPQRLLHPAECAGQDRPAPVESVTVHGLPVVDHPGRVLADQIGFQLRHGLRAGLRPALQDRLAETHQALVGVHLEK